MPPTPPAASALPPPAAVPANDVPGNAGNAVSGNAVPGRAGPDRCPGALRIHEAADGGLARIRIPGGLATAAQWRVLGQAAEKLGDGFLELTSRGNVQLRSLPAGAEAELSDRLAPAGLLPSPTHERVRNILASPLSGRDGAGLLDVHPLAAALDIGLCADPALADLPGRFLFAMDDGRRDVAGLGADVLAVAVAPDLLALLPGGVDVGLRMRPDSAVAGVLAAARAFLAARAEGGSRAWRLSELDDGPARVAAHLSGTGYFAPHDVVGRDVPFPGASSQRSSSYGSHGSPSQRFSSDRSAAHHSADADEVISSVRVRGLPRGRRGPLGPIAQLDGRVALAVAAPLGRMSAAAATVLADAGTTVCVTPWRSTVVLDIAPGHLAGLVRTVEAVGLILDAASPWAGVSACAGRPGCAKSLADVRADAAATVARVATAAARDAAWDTHGAPDDGRLPVHWIGCERRCGRPAGRSVEVLATADGYRVSLDGQTLTQPGSVTIDAMPAVLANARRKRRNG